MANYLNLLSLSFLISEIEPNTPLSSQLQLVEEPQTTQKGLPLPWVGGTWHLGPLRQ